MPAAQQNLSRMFVALGWLLAIAALATTAAAQPVAPDDTPPAPQAPDNPPAPASDDLFGEGSGPGDGAAPAIDPATPQLIPGNVIALPAGAPRTLEYRLHVDQPGLLTLMIDCPAPVELIIRGPRNRLIMDETLRLAGNLSRQELRIDFDLIEGEGGFGNIRMPSYRLIQPGDYLISLVLTEATEQPTHLAAGLVSLPEDWFAEVDPDAAPAQPGNPEKTAVALEVDKWATVGWPVNSHLAWVKFTAKAEGLYLFSVRPNARQDTTLRYYGEGAMDVPLASVDNDPFGHYGKESILVQASANTTYYIAIEDLGQEGGAFRGMLMRLPDELPPATDPPPPAAPAQPDVPAEPQPQAPQDAPEAPGPAE